MPDRESFFTNAWESTAPSGLTDVSFSLTVGDATALQVPGYIVIDPDDPTLREYLYISAKVGNVLTIQERNGAGSFGQVAHAADAVVRSVASAQAFTDLHDRINVLTTVVAGQDPSGVYLPLSGGSMAGTLNMDSNQISNLPTPTQDGHAARKLYVDTQDTSLSSSLTSAYQAADSAHVAAGDPHAQYLTEAAAGSTYLPLSGGVMTGTLNMSQEILSNPADPTAGFHVGDRAYNDARYLGISANAASATKLNTARTIDITGDITATAVAFDGTANIAISAAVNNDSHTHNTQYYTESESDSRFLSKTTPLNTADNSFANYRIRNIIIQSGTPGSGGRKIGDLWFQT